MPASAAGWDLEVAKLPWDEDLEDALQVCLPGDSSSDTEAMDPSPPGVVKDQGDHGLGRACGHEEFAAGCHHVVPQSGPQAAGGALAHAWQATSGVPGSLAAFAGLVLCDAFVGAALLACWRRRRPCCASAPTGSAPAHHDAGLPSGSEPGRPTKERGSQNGLGLEVQPPGSPPRAQAAQRGAGQTSPSGAASGSCAASAGDVPAPTDGDWQTIRQAAADGEEWARVHGPALETESPQAEDSADDSSPAECLQTHLLSPSRTRRVDMGEGLGRAPGGIAWPESPPSGREWCQTFQAERPCCLPGAASQQPSGVGEGVMEAARGGAMHARRLVAELPGEIYENTCLGRLWRNGELVDAQDAGSSVRAHAADKVNKSHPLREHLQLQHRAGFSPSARRAVDAQMERIPITLGPAVAAEGADSASVMVREESDDSFEVTDADPDMPCAPTRQAPMGVKLGPQVLSAIPSPMRSMIRRANAARRGRSSSLEAFSRRERSSSS